MNQLCPILGATPLDDARCAFRLWAPTVENVALHLYRPVERIVPLQRDTHGYHTAIVENVAAGTDYAFRLDDGPDRPDPASLWQPNGVHGPSRVLDPRFAWTDQSWIGLPWRDYVLYEIHVGTFSKEGTFEGVIRHLAELKELGITAIELMPVAQFPGSRNWGYDGVCPFAVQDSYGGPAGLKRLVNAAHEQGLAVVLDVVYNHLGPEGNYLAEFAPYFTERYRTPWGSALNFDGRHSDEVRRYFTDNALYWQTDFHVDGLRLDAVHAIRDFSAVTFLEELAEACHVRAERLDRRFHVIAESDMNMARHILPRSLGGYGLDAQWSDDFHHSLHVLLTGEQNGYYEDFSGVSQFARVWREGYAYTGTYSRHRGQRHGSSPGRNPVEQFVVCSQNHDQVGNRMLGDRLSKCLSFEQQKLAAGTVLLSPFIPLLFMGEEYGETAPFQYFISHTDPALVEAVRKGRRAEFAAFGWEGEVPDPQAESTFECCKLNHALAHQGRHKTLRDFYRALLTIRRQTPALSRAQKDSMEITPVEAAQALLVRQWHEGEEIALAFNFSSEPRSLDLPLPAGRWHKRLDTADVAWAGPGPLTTVELSSPGWVRVKMPAASLVLYQKLQTN